MAGNTAGLDQEKVLRLKENLKRLFALPIRKATMRELQGVFIKAVGPDDAKLKAMFESFLSGELKPEISDGVNDELYAELIDEFGPYVRLSKDVHDRGEFLGFVTTDILEYKDKVLLSNYIRKINGEETHVITEMETTVKMLNHLSVRLLEVSKIDPARKELNEMKEALENLKYNIELVLLSLD